MRFNFLLGAAAFTLLLFFASCDNTTNEIGTTLTDNVDHLEITSNTYFATSRSTEVHSVVSRSATGYLGRIIDPETGSRITGDFMTQFNCPEKYSLYKIDSIASKDENGMVYADSCEVRLFYTSYYGDSLSTMKITLYELDHPMLEDKNYYSDFSPLENGYVRADGIKKSHTYSLVNTKEKSNKKKESNYVDNICVRLNDPYTDRNGNVYNNFGTFILRNYYSHPEYFKNSYEFAKNLLPGFFFKVTGGLGAMAYISIPQLNIYCRHYIKKDSIATGLTLFNGTEEVLQTTTITNDQAAISALVEDETCTYIKSPSGIFTEVTLPVDEIIQGHENDTINTATITFKRINNEHWSKYSLPASSTLLLLETDSVSSFFERGKIPNSKQSFLTSYNSSSNSYVFSNIAGLVTTMHKAKIEGLKKDPQWLAKHPNWNKVTLVPVKTTTTTSSTSTTIVTGVTNDMSLTSTRLVGGRTPIEVNVIYSKFK